MDTAPSAIAILWVVGTTFLAVVVQSIAGFGSALVAAPLLVSALTTDVAIPVLSLIGVTQNSILWLVYRKSFNWRATARLTLASTAFIPVGILWLSGGAESFLLGLLGAILIGYALWELARLQLPELKSPGWAYVFGGIAGAMSGA